MIKTKITVFEVYDMKKERIEDKVLKLTNMLYKSKIAEPIYVDGAGLGAYFIDRLRANKVNVIEVITRKI
jgi:hypothetical protein